MINTPSLQSLVLWRNVLNRVQKRSRNEETGNVTLWLCDCIDEKCRHTKQPAPLEECTPIPSGGDTVCHHLRRTPHTVTGAEMVDNRCYLTLQPEQGEPLKAPLAAIDYYPLVGDEVLVAASPYCDWILEKARPLKRKSKEDHQKYRELVDSLDDLWWTSTIFTLRLISATGLAVLKGDGLRREAPINCLRVYRKKDQVDAKSHRKTIASDAGSRPTQSAA